MTHTVQLVFVLLIHTHTHTLITLIKAHCKLVQPLARPYQYIILSTVLKVLCYDCLYRVKCINSSLVFQRMVITTEGNKKSLTVFKRKHFHIF